MSRLALLTLLLALAVLGVACSQPSAEVSSNRSQAAPSEPSSPSTPQPTSAPTPEATPTPEPVADVLDGHQGHDGVDATDVLDGRAGAGTPAGLPSAEELIEGTRVHLQQWQDVEAAKAAGFRSIGDAFTGWEHLVQPEWAGDDVILDPTRPESLVYRVDGEDRELVSAMYLLPPDSTMEDVPDLGDDRATWHIHEDLCFDEAGRLAGIFRDGQCLFGGEHRITTPMIHVWIVEHPCGPFAAIEGHGDVCDAPQDH